MEIETRTNPEGIMVTVICITYNHEQYIAEALESFVRQKTNFKFKVFVGEDCGPDKTAEIVKEYAEKYPDIIVPFLREQNMGAQRNLIDLCQCAESPYIAFCEGDDYWIDDYKLQKQFDYMEENPELRACYCRTKIEAPEDWHLRSYYIANKQGELIWPDCEPGYKVKLTTITCFDYISFFPAHTSTMFFRWNYSLCIPEWYFKGIIGDTPLFLMQLGEGAAGFLPDVTSVYRRSDVGVFMSTNQDEHFLKTRLDYVRWISGMLDWYLQNQKNYPKIQLENRIKLEAANYLRTAIKVGDYQAIQMFFETYPDAAVISLNAYLSFYNDSRALTRTCTWDGYKLLVRNRYYRNGLRPYIKLIKIFDKIKKRCKKIKNKLKGKLKNICSFMCYWGYSFVPKQKNIWVFAGFNKHGYLDNAKYFYEYVVMYHPEIEAYWLTLDDDVYKNLKERNMPVCKFRTKECRKILSHAEIAVTDHFVMSDYESISGFNNKAKIVQLWHGVGFKSMGDGKNVKNTNVAGVQYSYDILPDIDDSFFMKISKKIKYFRHAYYRELFEEYFMMVCPGQERVEMLAKVWNIPEEKLFMSGHPRNLPVYQMRVDKISPKILYAPTYRFNVEKEQELINNCIAAFDEIELLMKSLNASFVLRLHPHTWRNYKPKILNKIKNYSRISLDEEKDIYPMLGSYAMIISDYSSIALDFALLKRPSIFLCPDYNWYIENEAGFNIDFKSYIPGPMTQNWGETLKCIAEYIKNPEKDAELREKVCSYFYDMSVNDEHNSERIVLEIKRRLNLD